MLRLPLKIASKRGSVKLARRTIYNTQTVLFVHKYTHPAAWRRTRSGGLFQEKGRAIIQQGWISKTNPGSLRQRYRNLPNPKSLNCQKMLNRCDLKMLHLRKAPFPKCKKCYLKMRQCICEFMLHFCVTSYFSAFFVFQSNFNISVLVICKSHSLWAGILHVWHSLHFFISQTPNTCAFPAHNAKTSSSTPCRLQNRVSPEDQPRS